MPFKMQRNGFKVWTQEFRIALKQFPCLLLSRAPSRFFFQCSAIGKYACERPVCVILNSMIQVKVPFGKFFTVSYILPTEITVAMLKTSKFKWYFQVCWFLMFFFFHVLQILVDACAWEVAVHCCKFCIWPSRKTCSLVGCELSLVCFWLFFADEQGDVVAVLQPTSATELNPAFSIVGIGRACVVPGFLCATPFHFSCLLKKAPKTESGWLLSRKTFSLLLSRSNSWCTDQMDPQRICCWLAPIFTKGPLDPDRTLIMLLFRFVHGDVRHLLCSAVEIQISTAWLACRKRQDCLKGTS